jgi:site-specific recombinase XerD
MEQHFINELRGNFNLRKPKSVKPTNIYFIVYMNGKQLRFATGVKVYPEHWNKEKQECYTSFRLSELDNKNNLIVNTKITEFRNNFIKYKLYLCDHLDDLDNKSSVLKQFIYKDMNKKENSNINATMNDIISKDPMKESSKNVYYGHIKQFCEFAQTENLKTINDIDSATLYKFFDYSLKRVIRGKNIGVTSANRVVDSIISILNKCAERGSYDNTRISGYRKTKSKKGNDSDKPFLTEEEVENLWNLSLTGKKELLRDCLVFLCRTGQRFSDLKAMNETGTIESFETGTAIKYKSVKEDNIVYAPLLKEAKTIYDKYNGAPIITQKITQRIANRPSANDYQELKNIAKEAGITRVVTIKKENGTKIESRNVEAWTIIGTHTGRRTFINNAIKDGMQSRLIMKVTGHKTEDAFNKYVGVTSKDGAQAFLEKENKEALESTDKTIEEIHTSKQIDVFNKLFAGDIFLGFKDHKIKESIVNKAVDILTSYNNNIKDCIVDPDLSNKLSKINNIIWEIGKKYADPYIWIMYLRKKKDLGLYNDDIPTEIELNELWQQEIANDEVYMQSDDYLIDEYEA